VCAGLGFGLYYTAQYAKYSEQSMVKYTRPALAVVALALFMVAGLTHEAAVAAVGLLGCTLAVLVMSSPLAVIATVVATKDTSSMPFVTSLATFLNAASWTAYGVLVANDAMVYVPNVLGLCAASVQMMLYAVYGIQ
jgi:solute carrier family 50 protein (sugar transporter)